MSNIGFQDITTYDMDHTSLDTMGVILAHKSVNGKEVVAVALRGDKYEQEMAANLIAGTEGDITAFADAEALVESRVSAYLAEHGITSAKYWVTGYSRSGDVANIFGRELNKVPERFFTSADEIINYLGQESTLLPQLRKQLKDREKGIDNLLNAIQMGIFTPSTKERLESLEQQKEELQIRIAQEEIIKPPLDKDKILFWLYRFRKMDTTKLEHRKRLIDSFVNAIYLYDDKVVFTFNYKDGSKTITMEEIENSSLSSDLTPRGAPTYANKKDIRPEKPDFIGLFHVSEACPRAYKNVDVKRLFYRFSGK